MAAAPSYGCPFEYVGNRPVEVKKGNSSILASTSDVVVTFVQPSDGSHVYV